MKFFIVCLLIAVSGLAKSEIHENENFDESSKDNSVFDRILAINEKSGRSRSGQKVKLFEGDIVITKSVKEMMENRKRGAASNYKGHNWPMKNGKNEIPYVIHSGISGYRDKILGAMREWSQKVPCLSFVPRSNQGGYLYFASGSGCSSAVGYQRRSQKVSLARGCMHHGIIVHEIGHALGFWHEQSRSDRDNYITIQWQNIRSDMQYNFKTMPGRTDDSSHGYDYDSIMHYGPKAFSSNGRVTITPKKAGQSIGQRGGLSRGDVQQAMTMYKCNGGSTGGGGGGGSTGGGGQGGGTGCLSDKSGSCRGWAAKGYCRHSYVQYMMQNCKKSCYCSGNVTDRNERCREWANRGECHKNPGYMLRNCLASCCKC